MYLFPTLINFIILIVIQVIIFKLIKFKNKWHISTFLIFLIIFIIRNEIAYLSLDFFNYLILNLVLLLSYLVFLTLIFNGSPSLFFLNNIDQNDFINRGFIKERTKLMLNDNLINEQNQITPKGHILLRISKILSNIFFKEND
tara:strand:+ start:2756 stop:3184 length:429 start_codon:yes stop_codon:yes gene_type:complete